MGSLCRYKGGGVYVYEDDGATYKKLATLKASDDTFDLRLGVSVALTSTFVLSGAFCADPSGEESGSAYVFPADPDLKLKNSSSLVHAGDTLTFSTYFGYPGDPVGLAGVAVNGIPTFHWITFGAFDDPSFKWILSGRVPTGLAGLDVTFQSFGLNMCGVVEDSNTVLVRFR
ncbi:MAG: hypothetical protein AB1486_13850 [Planctomycetota bacterium]